jgi:hypothetical protein
VSAKIDHMWTVMQDWNTANEMWGSYGDNCEGYCLLGFDTIQFGR